MFNWLGLIQILIIAVIVWLFYRSFIENTSSEKMVRGLLGLAGLWVLSFVLTWAHLDLLGAFLHWTALFLSLGLIVIFQPELRKFMALLPTRLHVKPLTIPMPHDDVYRISNSDYSATVAKSHPHTQCARVQ